MPLLDSFTVDHKIMKAPAVRVAKTMTTPGGDTITVFDLRFNKPNVDMMGEKGIHTLEHLFAGFIRAHLMPMMSKSSTYRRWVVAPVFT